MNVRLLLAGLFLLLAFAPLSAQTFRPLAGYEALAAPAGKATTDADKAEDCNGFLTDGFTLVSPGETLQLRIFPDTAGLGDDLTIFTCEGCNDAEFGTATYANDTLVYGADAGAALGVDTLRLSLCNAAGLCSDVQTIVVLVRRAGQEIDLPMVEMPARGLRTISFPAGDLPGGTTCRTLESCAPDYGGRSQQISFFRSNEINNNLVIYQASGYDGIDAVCVTICNDFGICDTYRQEIKVDVARVDLPFFDDFAYTGVRPDRDLWQDEDVLINRNFPQSPPSIGVATFDGVDFSGQSYPPGSGGRVTTVRDYLTSAPVNAGGLPVNADLALNFFLQPRGFGNRPETQDSFLVQFLAPDGEWRNVFSQAGLPTTYPGNEPTFFEVYTIPVPLAYRYNGFQFRFASRSSEQGAVDMWNLDYVKLSFISPTPTTNDLAIVERPGFILRSPFSSLPIRHLRAGGEGLLEDDLRATLRNLSTMGLTVSQASELSISTDVPFSLNIIQSDFTAAFQNIGGTNNEVAGGNLVVGSVAITSLGDNYEQLRNYLFTQIDEAETTSLNLEYNLDIPSQANGFGGGVLTINDFASQTTRFDNYMAYDDGTAELTIEGQRGTTILQRYQAFVADELTGIQIRIPRGLGGLGDQDIRLVVYNGEEQPEELLYEVDFGILYAENFGDTLEGYTTYIFPDMVDIPSGNFYVGWEQQRASRDIGIGFDRNTPPPANEGYQWFNTGGGWNELTGTLNGAIMIRPLLSGFDGFTTSTDDEPAGNDALIDVYPNPTNGTLHLRPRQMNAADLTYTLYTFTGAVLSENHLGTTLELGHLPPGIYLLEVTDGQVSSRHKIVRR